MILNLAGILGKHSHYLTGKFSHIDEKIPLIEGTNLTPQDLREFSMLDRYLTDVLMKFTVQLPDESEHDYTVLYRSNEPGYGPSWLVLSNGNHNVHNLVSGLVAKLTQGKHIPPGAVVLRRPLGSSTIADYIDVNEGARDIATIEDGIRLKSVGILHVVYADVPQSVYDNPQFPVTKLRIPKEKPKTPIKRTNSADLPEPAQ